MTAVLPAPLPVPATGHRDNQWLAARTSALIAAHFPDAAKGCDIVVSFDLRARLRLGSIALRERASLIRVNRALADPAVPAMVIDSILAHELAHYAHGFGSDLPRLHRHPHAGGVVDRELAARGLSECCRSGDAWLKQHWPAQRTEPDPAALRRWDAWLQQEDRRPIAAIADLLNEAAHSIGVRDAGALPRVDWLRASTRQRGLTYMYRAEATLRVHGLAASQHVPLGACRYEIGWWLFRLAGHSAGAAHDAASRTWPADCRTHHEFVRRQWPSIVRSRHPLRIAVQGTDT